MKTNTYIMNMKPFDQNPFVIGTAGHIDHGKTTLVKALTGVNTDRLKEEKERGISIELGFAYKKFVMSSGASFYIHLIDVPGHEKFIRQMIRGAGGIECVLFIVSADEGIMPQTREHVEICELLSIPQAIIVMTKCDKVSYDRIKNTQNEIKTYFSQTKYSNASIVETDAITGKGIEDLKQVLFEIFQKREIKNRAVLPAYFPIDRVFSLKGFGTIATGTLLFGSLKLGQELVSTCMNSQKKPVRAKIKHLKVHDHSYESISALSRLAVNVANIEVSQLSKGQILFDPDRICVSDTLLCQFHFLKHHTQPLKNNSEFLFFINGSSQLARLEFSKGSSLSPGSSQMVIIHLKEPIVVFAGLNYIIRGFTKTDHGQTIGGGEVIDPLPSKKKNLLNYWKKQISINDFQNGKNILNHIELIISEPISQASDDFKIYTYDQLRQRTAWYQELLPAIKNLRESSKVDHFLSDSKEIQYFSPQLKKNIQNTFTNEVTNFHKNNPLLSGINHLRLFALVQQKFNPNQEFIISQIIQQSFQELVKQGSFIIENELCRNVDHHKKQETKTDPKIEKVFDYIRNLYPQSFQLENAVNSLSLSKHEIDVIMVKLITEKKVIQIDHDYYLENSQYEKILFLLKKYFQTEKELDIGSFKSITGLSRRIAVAILEYCDNQKITLRIGDKRILRKKELIQ